ncbi:MAG: Rne/Rng family ribonuclease [Muribaculaceae bacterium]|nr:Rne/Rng family ribonuclease [Muribaculaceae bacterium]
MKSELIVDVQPGEVSIALLEDSRLVSLQKEGRNISYAVGDIYLAKVKKLMPGLNAAFVNVGYEKDAFLHYLDLGPNFATYAGLVNQTLDVKKKMPHIEKIARQPEIDKHGSITDLLAPGRELLVQIVKEPISSKGPRLTTEISFTGRNMVLIPFGEKVSVSQKISSSAEKVRLRKLIESIKPENFGVIIRTSAEGKKVQELMAEMRQLTKRWDDALAKARQSVAPALVYEEETRAVGVLRDVFNPSFESIHVNDADTFDRLRDYVGAILPEKSDIVKLYAEETPIFDHFGITRQIKSSFGKTVSFKSGAYIIIEHTEALHVIDVNSGNRARSSADQETNALDVNLRAAEEIARQLRLRDMGGIIVIDFIDMAKVEHRQKLFEYMRELMATDRARHNILPLSKFGLMQITRQRVRPDLEIETTEKCPSCMGKGEVMPSLLFTDTLREKLDYCINGLGQSNFVMYVHPYVEAYIKKGLFSSLYRTWRNELGRKFKIVADQSLAYLQYKVIGQNKQEIDLREEKDVSSSATKNKRKAKTRAKNDGDDASPSDSPAV